MNKVTKKRFLPLAVSILILTAAQSLFADQNPERRAFPLPISVEGKWVKSKLFTVVNFDGTFVPFSSITDSGSEGGFVKTQSGFLVAGNFSGFSSGIFPTAGVTSNNDIFDMFSGAYQSDPPDYIKGFYRWGGLDYFVLGSNPNTTGILPFLAVRQGKNFSSGLGFALNPVIENLSALSRARLTQPKIFDPAEDADGQYSVRIPSPVSGGNEKSDAVEFRFNGREANFDVLGNDSDGDKKHKNRDDHFTGAFADLVKFYQGHFAKLKNGDSAGYLADFDQESQDRLAPVVNALTPKQLNNYISMNTGGSHVIRFILNAGSIKFIFYQTQKDGRLMYDTLQDVGGSYQLVNAGFKGAIDHLFQSDIFMGQLKQIAR